MDDFRQDPTIENWTKGWIDHTIEEMDNWDEVVWGSSVGASSHTTEIPLNGLAPCALWVGWKISGKFKEWRNEKGRVTQADVKNLSGAGWGRLTDLSEDAVSVALASYSDGLLKLMAAGVGLDRNTVQARRGSKDRMGAEIDVEFKVKDSEEAISQRAPSLELKNWDFGGLLKKVINKVVEQGATIKRDTSGTGGVLLKQVLVYCMGTKPGHLDKGATVMLCALASVPQTFRPVCIVDVAGIKTPWVGEEVLNSKVENVEERKACVKNPDNWDLYLRHLEWYAFTSLVVAHKHFREAVEETELGVALVKDVLSQFPGEMTSVALSTSLTALLSRAVRDAVSKIVYHMPTFLRFFVSIRLPFEGPAIITYPMRYTRVLSLDLTPDSRHYSQIAKTVVCKDQGLVVKVFNDESVFDVERKALLSLSGIHRIAKVMAIGKTAEGFPFITTPYLGSSLDRVPSVEELQDFLDAVIRPMHLAGWHHHDLKLDNIIRGQGGLLYLIDFSLATQTCQGPCPDLLWLVACGLTTLSDDGI
ncbi:hypothetical protein FA15DRAFT_753453 [Coprinopsis marcescibilis]|uniref:Protein kinase domain-containing protein n=1 Tax=Coprinopsis marcescibilis TaxID=230819 RepID=A0A5C3L729_COPMA|nr:hypothetical protein FA15DRAFT_753453 [Coprinopsis marcescibilis]